MLDTTDETKTARDVETSLAALLGAGCEKKLLPGCEELRCNTLSPLKEDRNTLMCSRGVLCPCPCVPCGGGKSFPWASSRASCGRTRFVRSLGPRDDGLAVRCPRVRRPVSRDRKVSGSSRCQWNNLAGSRHNGNTGVTARFLCPFPSRVRGDRSHTADRG